MLWLIRRIHAASRGTYGVPRIQAELRRLGRRHGQVRITRLMSMAGLRGVCRRNRVKTTRADGSAVAVDRVKREFSAARPNELWVADSTYVPTRAGTLYLAVITDVYSRRVVGWSMSPRQRSGLMVGALQMALNRRSPQGQVIHHSDRGSQYTSAQFQAVCRASKVTVSMGSVGDCYDNAMAESFFATLETELIDRQPQRRFRNRDEARREIFEYIESFYNSRRLHSALGYRSPVEFEQHHRRLVT